MYGSLCVYRVCILYEYLIVFDFFFFKQKTAYEMRISDWSSDVCSSDLPSVGVRRYGESDVNRLRFIRHAQKMGFSLDEIAGLLQITGKHSCEQNRQLTERKLVAVSLRIRQLRNLERALEQKVARCARVTAGE